MSERRVGAEGGADVGAVGELVEVGRLDLLADAVQRRRIGRRQLHRLARELGLEVARVRVRHHLRLERRRDLLQQQQQQR